MSFVTCNGAAIQTMRLSLPYRGVWQADVVCDAAAAPKAGDRVTIEGPGGTFVGTARRPGADQGAQVSVRVLGGGAGLATELAPRPYANVTVREVLQGIAGDAGETISRAVSADVLDRALSRWNRDRGDGRSCLTALANKLGATWRVLDDGGIWIGTDAGAAYDPTVTVTEESPATGEIEIAPEDFGLRPGMTFLDLPVFQVVYEVGGAMRAKLSRNPGGGAKERADRDRMRKGLAEAGFPYVKLWRAKVTSQNADGTLELKVDEGKDVGSQSKVPIRHGLFGVTRIEIEPGAEVLLGFDDADREQPYASLPLKGGRVVRLTLDGDVFELGGTDAVAIARKVEQRLTAIETFLKSPGPISGPAPLAPTPIDSTSLFAS